jgi:hypothetical protein
MKRKKHWTDSVRINEKFATKLKGLCPEQVNNKGAYLVYGLFNAQRKTYPTYDAKATEAPKVKYDNIWHDPFLQMNVRNQLCKLEHVGRLERIAPGNYIWMRKP